jgi:tripartite-type tricarboxylate transporter receptor subunit TctC
MPGLVRLFAILMIALWALPAAAQTYPNRPIRLLVGFPPGGATDIIARLVAQGLSTRLGVPVVVENKPGSGTNIAGDAAAKADPDGYTILHGPDNMFIANPHLYAKMTFDPLKDLAPITSLVANQMVLAVHPSVQAQSFKEFVELARRANPSLFYASIGIGSQHHLAMEMLKQEAGISLTHVPFRGGGPAAVALLGNQVSAMFGGGSIVSNIKAGQMRALAVTGNKRHPLLPELPTIGEFYPGYEVLIWHGLFAPAGTPQPVIDRLRTETRAVLADSDVIHKLGASGSGEPYLVSDAEFAARIRSDYEKYGKVIRTIGAKME